MAAMKALMTVALLFALLVASSSGQPTMDARDKAALTALRGAVENKWKFPEIKCYTKAFQPFFCDGSGRIYHIYLAGRGLRGRISWHIGNLTKLQTLYLHVNNFTGGIPWSIGNLKSLRYLTLAENQLNGSIPWSIGDLRSLQILYLYDNKLTGSIPWSIGYLKSLVELFLSRNKLSGNIPWSIGDLKSLQYAWLGGNQLSGRIPSSIPNMKSLQYLDINFNYFTGPIVQVNDHPSCYEIGSNCLFGSRLPKGCQSSLQRSKATCLSFCNAIQAGGPCGGKGICSIGTDGKTGTCACYRGYTNTASKYTCK